MKKGKAAATAMLELWRPPSGAGDPVGCLATTYTFQPALFDEQCLGRFLAIDSEPDREDFAFLLERESRLGSVYAGVLADYTMAGVEHSLRWDVLPVRIPSAKQHAKISILAWARRVRVIVASANLTEPGYRSNQEVAGTIELGPEGGNREGLERAIEFLDQLLTFVPRADTELNVWTRARDFLRQVESLTSGWQGDRRRSSVRQHLVFTLPATEKSAARSALSEVVDKCPKSPAKAWVASPFFDGDGDSNRVASALFKALARGVKREVWFCVPDESIEADAAPRLAAPKSLVTTPTWGDTRVRIATLPKKDGDKNLRPWHAKMLWLEREEYSALMIGSSNFTVAGMGAAGPRRNAEANLLTIVENVAFRRESGSLKATWPDMDEVDPEDAEWLGAKPEEDEADADGPPLPEGFLAASYSAGDQRSISILFAPAHLPASWEIWACGRSASLLLNGEVWRRHGASASVQLPWKDLYPPEKLEVRWGGSSAFLALNVEDAAALPRPAELDNMSADEMLSILAAADPSAAIRSWARKQKVQEAFDEDLDSAAPIDLDPLRRYNLQETFLHRIRARARVFAQLRANLQRPVWGLQALEWRLRGLIGVESLADRYLREFLDSSSRTDEALLTLSDLLLVLTEVEYQPVEGTLSKADFSKAYRPFLRGLAAKLGHEVGARRDLVSGDMLKFWERVVERCRA